MRQLMQCNVNQKAGKKAEGAIVLLLVTVRSYQYGLTWFTSSVIRSVCLAGQNLAGPANLVICLQMKDINGMDTRIWLHRFCSA